MLDSFPDHQLDIFYWQPNRVGATQSLPKVSKEHDLPVPSGTIQIVGHLLTQDGIIAQSFTLHSPYSFVGEAKSALSIEQQIREDILAGESDIREMKAFFNPDENATMRNRVLHSSIAFANTAGGSIYIGVEDDGELSRNAKLVNAMKKSIPEEAARELGAKMRKYILESTRPVVDITTTEVRLGSEWVVRLRVEASSEIISTQMNDVFIRAGASNRRPPAEWLEARAARRGPAFPSLESSYY